MTWNDLFLDHPAPGYLITAARLNAIISQIESGIVLNNLADVEIAAPAEGDFIVRDAVSYKNLHIGDPNKFLKVNPAGTTFVWSNGTIGSGDVATDEIWEAKGDLVVGTGANAATRLPADADGKILQLVSGTPSWEKITISDYLTLMVKGCNVPKTYPPVVDEDETSTNKNTYTYAEFPNSDNDTNLQWVVNLPADWKTDGNIEAYFIWTAPAGSGSVIWQLFGKLFNDGDAMDTALTQIGGDVTDTYLDTGDIMVSPATTAAVVTSVSTGGNYAVFKVKRNSGTKSEIARLLGVRIKYIRTVV